MNLLRPSKLASFIVSSLTMAVSPAGAQEAASLRRYSFSEIHMGAPWKIVLYAADESLANQAATAAFARIEELNDILSDYDSESELSRLSATSPSLQPVPVSDDLWHVLESAQKLAEKSDGAFDITVGPLSRLWRRARHTKEMPPGDLVHAARQATNYRALQLDPAAHTAKLLKANMRLDAGGIGMGYAVDEALKVLRQEGIASALIDASGDIGVSDAPPWERGWKIGIEPPAGEGPPSRFVVLANYAVTTSGDAFQAVEIEGIRYSHIIDPRTGMGVMGHSAVTVIAPDCITADSYTKPICVLGPEAGFKIIEAMPGVAALVEREVSAADGKRNIEVQESQRFHQFESSNK
ncbi:MAG TPA: FAD:protein FMN transferase [Pirellulales bacterium]